MLFISTLRHINGQNRMDSIMKHKRKQQKKLRKNRRKSESSHSDLSDPDSHGTEEEDDDSSSVGIHIQVWLRIDWEYSRSNTYHKPSLRDRRDLQNRHVPRQLGPDQA